MYGVVGYQVSKEDEQVDFENVAALAEEHKPKMIIAGGSACRASGISSSFRQIADSVGAFLVVDMARFSGLVAAGLHPNPCRIPTSPWATHKTLRGPRSGIILAREKYGAAIDKNVFPGAQGGPLMHIVAAKAVCFLEASQPSFKEYQQQVIANAKALSMGMRAEGFRVVSGNAADTHLLLVDVFSKGVRGREAENALDSARITVNKNAIPFDVNPPLNPSGIRLGSPAVTTRGFKEHEMQAGRLLQRGSRSHHHFRRNHS